MAVTGTGGRAGGAEVDTARPAVTYLCLLLVACVAQVDTQTRAPGDTNYCQWEDFSAQCPPGEVIVVQQAKYGRMERGRCVKRNYGYLGCAMDVLPYVDSRCSGRSTCSFSVFDDSLRKYKPCPEDISSFLQAKFTCLKVATGSKQDCARHHRIKVAGSVGYIASLQTVENGFGSTDCPWRIEVAKGQRVNLTLYNFARGRHVDGENADGNAGFSRTDICYELAEIREDGSKRRMTLCDGLERHTSVYVSRGNVIDVQMVSGGTLETLGYFLLKYEAIGCPDLKVPGGSWLKRDGEEAVVKCNRTGQTRYLTCKATQWIGEVGNCTSDTSSMISGVFSEDGIFPYGILIVVAIGVALGIFFGGLLLSVVVVYMKRSRQRMAKSAKPSQHRATALRQRDPETARELEETGGEKLYMRYEVDVDKGYPRHAVHDAGTLKGAPMQLPPPGVNCDTLHLHHHVQVAPESVDGKPSKAPGGAAYSHSATLTRPGSTATYNRQHIYESPTFT